MKNAYLFIAIGFAGLLAYFYFRKNGAPNLFTGRAGNNAGTGGRGGVGVSNANVPRRAGVTGSGNPTGGSIPFLQGVKSGVGLTADIKANVQDLFSGFGSNTNSDTFTKTSNQTSFGVGANDTTFPVTGFGGAIPQAPADENSVASDYGYTAMDSTFSDTSYDAGAGSSGYDNTSYDAGAGSSGYDNTSYDAGAGSSSFDSSYDTGGWSDF